MSSHIALRMCPECRTTDAHFPNIDGCRSCAEMLSQDEKIFWNTPIDWEERPLANGKVQKEPITPREVIRRCKQPWRTFFAMILLS